MRKNFFGAYVLLSSILTVGCSVNPSAKINAELHGMKQEDIVIEQIVPGKTEILDTVKTNNKGEFSYKFKFQDKNPVFLRVRKDRDFLMLLAAPGENIKLNSIVNLSRNYNVSGSVGSALLKDINIASLEANKATDELTLRYNSTTIDEERLEINREMNTQYINLRKKCVEFLVNNKNSLAAISVLYQTYPNGQPVFGGKSDHLFFTNISDTLSVLYPTSDHVRNLSNSVKEYRRSTSSEQSVMTYREGLPDIVLPDIYANEKKLTDLMGKKAILLMFWSVSDPQTAAINRELMHIYSEYKDKDFEIFQVSLDTDKSYWLQSVIQSNLPWISVRDQNGPTRSIAARTYQVNVLPFNYLINKEGIPVYKNLWGNDLAEKIKEVTK